MKKQGFPVRLANPPTELVPDTAAKLSQQGVAGAVAAKRYHILHPRYWPGYMTVSTPYVELGLSGPQTCVAVPDRRGRHHRILRLRPSVSGPTGPADVRDVALGCLTFGNRPRRRAQPDAAPMQQTVKGQPILFDLALGCAGRHPLVRRLNVGHVRPCLDD